MIHPSPGGTLLFTTIMQGYTLFPAPLQGFFLLLDPFPGLKPGAGFLPSLRDFVYLISFYIFYVT